MLVSASGGADKKDKRTYPSKSFKPQMMALDRFYLVTPRVPAVAVHLEGHMLRDRPLRQGADEGRAEAVECPFGGGRAHKPAAYPGQIQVGHGGGATVGCGLTRKRREDAAQTNHEIYFLESVSCFKEQSPC